MNRFTFSGGTLIAQADGSNAAIITFTVYLAAVMGLAWLSNRLIQSKSFMSEYFLGSRSLGVWAFALTFAATSSSGGSFMGFPSLVYTHGWVLALWIGSYMVVPIVSMGLLAKRLNQIGRRTGAITIPDVLRDRFECTAFGILATILIVFFMSFNLIAQFKAGSGILQTLLSDVPLFQRSTMALASVIEFIPYLNAAEPDYLLCLCVFAAAVVVYTTYGGFRAVVWTDVMQGLVMVVGVGIMLPLAIWIVGGLGNATDDMARMTTPDHIQFRIKAAEPLAQSLTIPKGTWFEVAGDVDEPPRFRRSAQFAEIPAGEALARVTTTTGDEDPQFITGLEMIPTDAQQKWIQLPEFDVALTTEVVDRKAYLSGANQPGVYLSAPGPNAKSADGFLPLSLAVSFFFMWTFSGAGQPSNMVRLMAFNQSSTLRRSIFTVAIYYSLIYFPLVIIFCIARVVLPGWEIDSDRIMPEMAKLLTMAINRPWLAGLLVAAPFAAVMSTMDSFLLMISSALVRDVYQRNISPNASDKTIKRLTYAVTIVVGFGAMLAAVFPPQRLQDIIVFTGSGLSTAFLAPMLISLYWPRANWQGAMGSMLTGFVVYMMLYAFGDLSPGHVQPLRPFNFHPFLIGSTASLLGALVITLCTPPPEQRLVRKFFCRVTDSNS